MTARTALRSAVRTATVALVAVPSAAAASAAEKIDDGSATGAGLSVIETLFWFVGLPSALFVGIALLAAAPSMVRGPRYRPGLGWWSAPVWFNGPESPDTALRTAEATPGGGGASARW